MTGNSGLDRRGPSQRVWVGGTRGRGELHPGTQRESIATVLVRFKDVMRTAGSVQQIGLSDAIARS